MKKLLLLLIAFIFPISVLAEGNVSITKIEEVEKKGEVTVLADPTFEGLNISYNLAFNSVGDTITYKATLHNGDTEDYRIENGTAFSKSGYITYTFNFSDNSDIIKANTTKDMFVTIKYNKAVPAALLANGEYEEENNMDVILTNSKGQIVNPKTSTGIAILVTLAVIVLIGSAIIIKKNKKVSAFILLLAVILPITVYALKEIRVVLNTRIVIEDNHKLCVYSDSILARVDENELPGFKPTSSNIPKVYYNYEPNMTLEEWLESDYNIDNIYINYFYSNAHEKCYAMVNNKYDFNQMTEEEYNTYQSELNSCDSNYPGVYGKNMPIKSRAYGCYTSVPE